MFCKYCGSKLIDGAAFCHDCGKSTVEAPAPQMPVTPPVPPVQPMYQQPVCTPPLPQMPAYQVPVYQQPVQPAYSYTFPPVQQSAPAKPAADPAVLEQLEKQALTLGIVGLCLSMLGLPGLIVSCIGAKKAGHYKKLNGGLSDKARTGYRLAKAGRTVGIIMTVLLGIILPTFIEEGILNDINPIEPFEYFDY